jgi:hypothetical protein
MFEKLKFCRLVNRLMTKPDGLKDYTVIAQIGAACYPTGAQAEAGIKCLPPHTSQQEVWRVTEAFVDHGAGSLGDLFQAVWGMDIVEYMDTWRHIRSGGAASSTEGVRLADRARILDRVRGELTASMLMTPGNKPNEIAEVVEGMIMQAYENARKRTRDVFSEGNGDRLLQNETRNPIFHGHLKDVRAEGATDEDIRWWWNMSVFEQETILMEDQSALYACYAAARDAGKTDEEARVLMFKTHPKFGSPDGDQSDDRPLPYELKRRVLDYSEKHCHDPQSFNSRIANYTSFNAMARAEMGAGNL